MVALFMDFFEDVRYKQFCWYAVRLTIAHLPVVAFKPCPIQLSIKVAEQDKNVMVKAFHTQQEDRSKETPVQTSAEGTSAPNNLGNEQDTWITFDKPILFVIAGKGPYLGR